MTNKSSASTNQTLKRAFFLHFVDGAPKGIHLTVLGQVAAPAGIDFQSLTTVLGSLKDESPITLDYGNIEQFGLNGQFKALTLNDSTNKMKAIHQKLADSVISLGFELVQPQFSGENYNPHLTLSNTGINSAEELVGLGIPAITVGKIALMESTFDSEGRFVSSVELASVELNG